MVGLAARLLPYALAFFSSLCIMILELVSSRLVAQHVGSSLTVWTSVIGIILGGICLGNVLGGWLADRVEPRRAVGPLFALGSLLVVGCLWINAEVGHIIPAPETINWELRTVIVVILDFLVPATVLGMVGPVVAKMAVEQAQRSGSAIGDVYFCGAIASIAGTFLAGFVLMYLAPSSTIVLLVAAALALLAAALFGQVGGLVLGLLTALLLGLGSIDPLVRSLGLGAIALGSYQINFLALAGNVTALLLGLLGLSSLFAARRQYQALGEKTNGSVGAIDPDAPRPSLSDLAILAFLASLGFMALEMVAGRMVSRHLGSSIYGWTSVIAVLLAGLSLGNFLGGRAANLIKSEKQASWLFLAASVLVLSVLLLESPPRWLHEAFNPGPPRSVLSAAISWSELKLPLLPAITLSWPYRVLLVTTLVFFLPAVSMGTVSPVVAKLAVDRLKRYKRTGTAIGQVYAWGMVGSILGTFLTGFVLIDIIGTKGVLLLLGTSMAFAATVLGSVWHAVWAGVPLGLCVVAFTPLNTFQRMGEEWGIREEKGNPATTDDGFAWIDESKYYFIKVTNEPEPDTDAQKRTLVLDNLIHGYFILGHPERLDYGYEHIYALVAYRAAKAGGKITLAPDSPPTTRKAAARNGASLPDQVFASQAKDKGAGGPDSKNSDKVKDQDKDKTKKATLDQAEKAKNEEEDRHTPVLPKVERSTLKTLFLGGGAYTFQRYMQYAYPGTEVDVAEIDRAVTNANYQATGLPRDTTIRTHWGDARQFVDRNQDTKQYDLIFGDAFNDFSVPWHLTTHEFNEKIAKMMSPTSVYMINIIDVYESDSVALKKAEKIIEDKKITGPAEQERVRRQELDRAHRYGGFLGAWVKTAALTFSHIYIFGTDRNPGSGLRETFVVVASRQPIDFTDLGRRDDDPQFYHNDRRTEPKPYPPDDEKAIFESRSRDIILTDDYAPVENLLAPVAETRADD
ncbi:MAG: fused MFS/spermidine synthase [Planctomycetaceae bacterium]|nr:fused MFS/spermidine synthase [Planctomycetaceae bacterium]